MMMLLNCMAFCKVVPSSHNSITSQGWGISHLVHVIIFLYSISSILSLLYIIRVHVFAPLIVHQVMFVTLKAPRLTLGMADA